MYDGIALAQTDAQALADDLADRFFHWKDPLYLGAAVAYALDATLTTITSFGLAKAPSLVHGAVGGIGAFGGAIAGGVAQYLQPLSSQTRDSGIRDLNVLFYNSSHTARQALEATAVLIFSGAYDNSSRSIIDYFASGSFLSSDVIPPQTLVEDFYRHMLVARVVNSLWRETSMYVLSTSSAPEYLHDFPRSDSYLNPFSNRTYIPYYYRDKHLEPLTGLATLNNSIYGINATQIAGSSGRAWEVAGFNYTTDVALDRLLNASTNPSDNLTPFQDQAMWEGVFTLPVCDIGTRPQWVVQYDSKTLPCCCGLNCTDTRAFVYAANLNKTRSWKEACRKQLKGSDLDFESIDYGIEDNRNFWDKLSTGAKAGFVIGCVGGLVFLILLLICCCALL